MGNVKMQKIDLCVIQDHDLAQVFLDMDQRPAVKTVVVIDQIVPPNSPKVSALHKALREKAEKEGLDFYYGKGMCAELLANGLLKADESAVVCDKAAGAAGAIGAKVFLVDAVQLKQVLETGELSQERSAEDSESKKNVVKTTGNLPEGLSAKDLALSLVKELGAEAISGKELVLTGDTLKSLDLSDKMTICGVLGKAGAVTAAVENAENVKTGEPAAFNTNTADSETSTYIFDAAKTREVTALPGGCTEIKPLSELSAVKIKSVFIGGTTGGTLKELAQAASMLKGRKIAYGLRLIVAPADADTYIKAATAGYLTDVLEAGGLVINHCGSPEVQGRIGKTEVMVSNDLENKPGYAGFETSKTYLTSTKAAVEAALLGTLGYKEEAPAEKEKTETRSLTFEGRCWKFGDDIDTDIIIPTQHLNYETMDEIKTHAFEPLRPDLAAKLREGDLIVAGSNFGCGSSREQAAEVLVANGVHCVIAKSFARIFFRNAINNGILLLECQDLADHVKEGDIIQVDLDNQKITADGKTYAIPAIPENLYHIIMDGGLVKSIMKKVEKGLL